MDKFRRMNSVDTILNGLYSVRDNTLLLNTTTSFVWIRDGVITQNPKKSNQTGNINLYETSKDIIITNNAHRWTYTYNDPTVVPTPANTTYSIVPLFFQTAYLGLGSNQRAVVPEWIITIYNKNKTKASFILTNYIQDLDGGIKKETRYININPQDYTEGGYSRVPFRPIYPSCIRSSLAIETAEKIQIQSIVVAFQIGEDAAVAARRSR